MIAIQFGTYEIIKARLQEHNSQTRIEGAIAKKQAARAAKKARAEAKKLAAEKGKVATPAVPASAFIFVKRVNLGLFERERGTRANL